MGDDATRAAGIDTRPETSSTNPTLVSRIEGRFNFDPLGTHNVKGHSPVKVWGIRTARVAPAAVQAEAVQ